MGVRRRRGHCSITVPETVTFPSGLTACTTQ